MIPNPKDLQSLVSLLESYLDQQDYPEALDLTSPSTWDEWRTYLTVLKETYESDPGIAFLLDKTLLIDEHEFGGPLKRREDITSCMIEYLRVLLD